jgi:hypothetical protein
MAIKIGEYQSKKFYKLGAKVVAVKILLDRLSRVDGRDEKDSEHLETSRRYAMKVAVHVLDEVILELKSEQMENSYAEQVWQRAHSERDWKNFDNLVAELANVRVMLDELSRVRGCNEKDNEHLATATRYVMKAAVHVLDDVVWKLNTVHIERLQEDQEWQKVQAESARQVIEEYNERKDAEFHRLSEEAEESAR